LNKLSHNLIDSIGYTKSIEKLAQLAGYHEVPPTIDEFCDEENFAGSMFGEGQMYPTWRQLLRVIYPHPLYGRYNEIALTGAIGIGKSTACLGGMSYDLCKLLHMRSPQETFKLVKSTPLVIAFINTTMNLAQAVLYRQFKNILDTSPFFIHQRSLVAPPLNPRERPEDYPHHVTFVNASRGTQNLGRGVISAVLSELNFQGEHKKDQAVQNYMQTTRRQQSRFGRGEGSILPGRFWLDSSRSDETGFLETHLKDMQKDPENCLIFAKPIWDIKEESGKEKYSGKRFLVYVGDGATRDPFIIDGPGQIIGLEDHLLVQVPEEYRKFFENDLFGAIRDYAGRAVWGTHKFIPQEHLIKQAMALRNPLTKAIIDLDFDNPQDQLINYIDLTLLPRDGPYFVHFDIGIKKDRTGIGFTRCIGDIAVERVEHGAMINKLTRDLVYRTELVIPVIAKPGKKVPLSKFKKLIVALMYNKIPIGGISADRFASEDLLQFGEEIGIPADIVSTDKTRDAMDVFRDALYEGRWVGPYHDILFTELKELIDNGDDVDHPVDDGTRHGADRPSKDVADGVVGSVYNCKQKMGGGRAITAYQAYHQHMKQTEKILTVRENMRNQMMQQNRTGKDKWRI
jgi:hypothetical protein